MSPASRLIVMATVLLGSSLAEAQEVNGLLPQTGQGVSGSSGRDLRRLTTNSTLSDLLHHPAFAGFTPLLLPWDDRQVDEAMRLMQIGSLLPYHTNVRPDEVASSLNLMIENAGRGVPIFHDIYTNAQKNAVPARRNTGLFYFKGRPNAPFAIIAAGGGSIYVGSVHEGFPYAEALNRLGYNAFVLRYRVGEARSGATEDLAFALSYVFRHSQRLEVSKRGYSLWGSSAGARIVASIGSHGTSRFIGDSLPAPSTVVMAYTAHSDRGEREPPTFAVVGAQDRIATPAAMQRRVDALRANGTDVDFRIYPDVAHGFGLGTGTSAEGWVASAVDFWKAHRTHTR